MGRLAFRVTVLALPAVHIFALALTVLFPVFCLVLFLPFQLLGLALFGRRRRVWHRRLPSLSRPQSSGHCWWDVIAVSPSRLSGACLSPSGDSPCSSLLRRGTPVRGLSTIVKHLSPPPMTLFSLVLFWYRKSIAAVFPSEWAAIGVIDGWLSNRELREFLLGRGYRFIPVVRIAPELYHVSLDDPAARFYPVNRLPKGWYGAGADAFADTTLNTQAHAIMLADHNKLYSMQKASSPYAVPRRSLRFLEEAGIPAPVPHAPPHPHPVHVALENRNLALARENLRNQDWAPMFIKEAKIKKMCYDDVKLPPASERYNLHLDGRDFARYQSVNMNIRPASGIHASTKLRNTPGSFADLEYQPPKMSSPVWFLHDVIQMLDAPTVGSWFDSNPHLNHLIATCVIPPETLWDLPALTPSLYDFRYCKNGKIIYFPEGDKGGRYEQPLAARSWLTANKLVTPGNECLHVSLLQSKFAHHILQISRTQTLADSTRSFDLPSLYEVGRHIMPFSGFESRLAPKTLTDDLIQFAKRYPKFTLQELYTKYAAHKTYMAEGYQESQIDAAVALAVHRRDTRWQTAGSKWVFFSAWSAQLLRIPLAAPGWLFQQFALSYHSSTDRSLPWTVETTELVSRGPAQQLGVHLSVCDPASVSFFFLPPSPSFSARFANFNARAGVWFGVKMVFVFGYHYFSDSLHFLPPVLNFVTYLLGMNWRDTPTGLIFVLLGAWFKIDVPDLQLPAIRRPLWQKLRMIYGFIFFLPSCGMTLPAGLSLPYQLSLFTSMTLTLFPRFNPAVFHEYGLRHGWVYRYWASTFVIGLFSVAWHNFHRQGDDLPHHGCRHQAPAEFPETIFSRSSSPDNADAGSEHTVLDPNHAAPTPSPSALRYLSSSPVGGFVRKAFSAPGSLFFPSPPRPRPTDLESGVKMEFEPCPSPVSPVPVRPFSVDRFEEVPLSPNPVREPAFVVNPLDPYAAFSMEPLQTSTPDALRRYVSSLPAPPETLDPSTSCVWNELAKIFLLSPHVMLAFYIARLRYEEREAWYSGFVEKDSLVDVFKHFRVNVRIYPAYAEEVDAPRAPGASAPVYFHQAEAEPMLSTEGFPGRYHQLYLSLTGRVMHLTSQSVARSDADVVTLPANGLVGFVSRSISSAELGSILTIPAGVYKRIANQFATGTRSAAMIHGLPSRGLPAADNLKHTVVSRQTVEYSMTPSDYQHAVSLAQDIKNNPSSLACRGMSEVAIAQGSYEVAKSRRHDFIAGSYKRTVRLHLYHGVGGCGKSTLAIKDLASDVGSEYDVGSVRCHAWMNGLRGPLQRDVQAIMPSLNTSINFATGAMPLVQPMPGSMFFDDATQLWPGFLQLFMLLNPEVTDIYATFDACQARTAFPATDVVDRSMPSTSDWLAELSDRYATVSYRLSPRISSLFGLPCAGAATAYDGVIALVSKVLPDIPFLVVSPRFAETQNSGGQKTLTFRDSQGITIDGDVSIDLGGLSQTATEHAWWTALTRARGNMLLHMGPLSSLSTVDESSYGRSTIISAILACAAENSRGILTLRDDPRMLVSRAVRGHMSRCLSAASLASIGIAAPAVVVGKVTEQDRLDWHERPRDILGDFWTPRSEAAMRSTRTAGGAAFSWQAPPANVHKLEHVREVLKFVAPITADHRLGPMPSERSSPPPPARLIAAPDPVLMVDTPLDPKDREFRGDYTWATQQHVEDGPNAILRHSRGDVMTEKMAIAKRITVGASKTKLTRMDGQRLKQIKVGFRKFFDVSSWERQSFDKQLFERAGRDAYSPWVSKRSARQIDSAVNKNDIDQPLQYAKLFMKTQYVKKEEARFLPAKAGQMISEFNHIRIFRDAPFALYLENLALKYRLPTTYLHCRNSPRQMNAWYREHWRPGSCTANDYTAWDSGCDEVAIEFACWLLGLSGIPEEYIRMYRHERLFTRSHLGPHVPKVESGDRYTWIVNTLLNAALVGASLDCPAGTPAGFSGDDCILAGNFTRQFGFQSKGWKMTAKPEQSSRLLFCGYEFGGDNIRLGPQVVLHRAQYGVALGRNDPDYWRSIDLAIRESAEHSAPEDPHLATAYSVLLRVCTRYGFPSLPTPLSSAV
nr:polyprotein [Sclerotinia sclerotiorum deltaflexivirus 2]